jgi:hypothetical protein
MWASAGLVGLGGGAALSFVGAVGYLALVGSGVDAELCGAQVHAFRLPRL